MASTQHGFFPESTFGAIHTIEKLLLETFASHLGVGYDRLPADMKAAGLDEIGTEIVGSDREKKHIGALYG